MATVTIDQAKTHLSKLIARVEQGEEIVITRDAAPVAKLTQIAQASTQRKPGLLKGQVSIPDSFFFDPLPEEDLRLWEGADDHPRR